MSAITTKQDCKLPSLIEINGISLGRRLVNYVQIRGKITFRKFSQTLNDRLPLKQGSNPSETSHASVSHNSQHLIFSCKKNDAHIFLIGKLSVLHFYLVFRGVEDKRTSKSDPASNFDPGTPILRSGIR